MVYMYVYDCRTVIRFILVTLWKIHEKNLSIFIACSVPELRTAKKHNKTAHSQDADFSRDFCVPLVFFHVFVYTVVDGLLVPSTVST